MNVYTPAKLLFISRINETRKFKFPSPNENKFAFNSRYFSARDLHSMGDFRLQYYLNRFRGVPRPENKNKKQKTTLPLNILYIYIYIHVFIHIRIQHEH